MCHYWSEILNCFICVKVGVCVLKQDRLHSGNLVSLSRTSLYCNLFAWKFVCVHFCYKLYQRDCLLTSQYCFSVQDQFSHHSPECFASFVYCFLYFCTNLCLQIANKMKIKCSFLQNKKLVLNEFFFYTNLSVSVKWSKGHMLLLYKKLKQQASKSIQTNFIILLENVSNTHRRLQAK